MVSFKCLDKICVFVTEDFTSAPFPWPAGEAQPHAWAQPDWAGSSLRSRFTRAKPALEGNVPTPQPSIGSGCMWHLSPWHSRVLHQSRRGVPCAGTFSCRCQLRAEGDGCSLSAGWCWAVVMGFTWEEMGFSSSAVIFFMFSQQETCHKKPSIMLG